MLTPDAIRDLRLFIVLPFAILFTFLSGCSGRQRDPVDMVPPDAGAWVAVRAVEKVSKSLGPLVARVPELSGAVELVESVSGIDLAAPDPESGFDPRRGVIAAAWRDGILMVLPVSDAGLVKRRIPLKLARFGFVETDGADGLMEFDSTARGHACVLVKSGLAVVFVGPAEPCAALAGLVEPPGSAGKNAPADPVALVEQELGTTGSDFVFHVSNRFFAPEVMRAVGLPTRGAAALVARGFLGDLRGTVGTVDGVSFRVAAGAPGQPFKSSPPAALVPAPVSVDVTVGPSSRPIVDTALSLAGRRFKGADVIGAKWSGTLRVVADGRGGSESPVAARDISVRGMLRRFNLRASAGVRGEPAELITLIAGRFGATAVPDRSGVDFKASGIGISARVNGGEIVLRASDGDAGGVAGAPSPGLPVVTGSARVLSASVEPEGLLDALGLSSIDYLRHIVDPLDAVMVELYYEGGRVVVDGRVKIR